MYKNKKILLVLFIILTFVIYPSNNLLYVKADKVRDLNEQITGRKSDIDGLKKQIESYQNKVKEAQKQSLSFKNQISLLDNEIDTKELEIELVNKQIQFINLEIQKTNVSIEQIENDIKTQKSQIDEILQTIYKNDQFSYLEIILLNNSFSSFFDHYQYLSEVESNLYGTLQKYKVSKDEIKIQKETLEKKKIEEGNLKEDLENKKNDFEERQDEKEVLLIETKKSEKNFQGLVAQLKEEQRQINSDIITLEKKVREELEKRKQAEKFLGFGKVNIIWPTSFRYITAYFHDPEYPFRYIFEHPAIDIRASQGSPVKAAESGYVAKVKNGGAKGYSYIMILHNDGISTVYGHVSKILVNADQFVNKGDIIALSGGKPGTPGAGNLSTGSHLHFEVRVNGIPVDPLKYLP